MAKVALWWRSSLANACIKEVVGRVSHCQNPFGLKTGRNNPVRGPQVLGNFFSRVFGDENESFGARVLFGAQN